MVGTTFVMMNGVQVNTRDRLMAGSGGFNGEKCYFEIPALVPD